MRRLWTWWRRPRSRRLRRCSAPTTLTPCPVSVHGHPSPSGPTDDDPAGCRPDHAASDDAASTPPAPRRRPPLDPAASALTGRAAVGGRQRGSRTAARLHRDPRIGVERSMYQELRLSTLDRGPGHWPRSAMPGEIGNVVVAGHRVSHNQDFRNLDELEPGDEVIFNTATGRHTYHVLGTEVVGPDAVWIVDQTPAQTGGPCSRAILRDRLGSASSCISNSQPESVLFPFFICARSRQRVPGRPVAPAVGMVAVGVRRHRPVRGQPRTGHRSVDAFRPRDNVRPGLDVDGYGLDVTSPCPATSSPAASSASIRARRARRTDGPVAHHRAAGRPFHRRGGALLVSSGDVPLASLGIAQVAGPLAEVARVGGVILIT